MTGTGWIHVSFAISGHFAFFVWSEKCLEIVLLIVLAHNVKYKRENANRKCQVALDTLDPIER